LSATATATASVALAIAAGGAWGVAGAGDRPSVATGLASSHPRAPRLASLSAASLGSSTYLGGTGTENINAVALDNQGNTYVTGFTESGDFPTAGALQPALVDDKATNVNYDAFVAKINAQGTALAWSTFLGGKGRDAGDAIAVGPDGSVFVTGYTESDDFPLAKPFQAAYGGGPSDAFVARIRPDGSGLAYSSYLGGKGTDGAKGLAVDADGSAFVTGSTGSANFPSVHPVPGVVSKPDDVDAFVVKLLPDGSGVQYATRLGAGNDDHGAGVAIDGQGSAYVTGDTRSPGFPTVGPLQATVGGTASGTSGNLSDAFVTKLSPSGSSVVYSTFLGGSDSDQGAGIAVDRAGSAYVTGSTKSTDFPTASPVQGGNEGDVDAFVSKLNADGSALVYSTYVGGSAADGGTAVAVDGSDDLVVAGSTGSTNLATARPVQPANGGGLVDAFLARFNPAGSVLMSSTYLGGTGDDQGSAVAVDASGLAHVVGYTNSPTLPAAGGRQSASLQPRLSGGVDGFVVVVSEAGGATSSRAAVPAARAKSTTHHDRVRLLTAVTLALLLVALAQTLYLRRRDGGGHGWRPRRYAGPDSEGTTMMDEPVPVVPARTVPPPPAVAGGPGVDPTPDPDATIASSPDNPWLAGGPPLGSPGEGGFLSPEPAAAPPIYSPPGAATAGGPDEVGNTLSGESEEPAPDLSFWDLFPDGPPAPPESSETGAGVKPLSSVDDRIQNLLAGFPLTGSRPGGVAGTGEAPAGDATPGAEDTDDTRPSWRSSLDDFARAPARAPTREGRSTPSGAAPSAVPASSPTSAPSSPPRGIAPAPAGSDGDGDLEDHDEGDLHQDDYDDASDQDDGPEADPSAGPGLDDGGRRRPAKRRRRGSGRRRRPN